jgi:hypothetical protein
LARPLYFGSVLAVGGGFVWTGNDDERYRHGATVSRLSPRTNRVVGRPLVLGSPRASPSVPARSGWPTTPAGW